MNFGSAISKYTDALHGARVIQPLRMLAAFATICTLSAAAIAVATVVNSSASPTTQSAVEKAAADSLWTGKLFAPIEGTNDQQAYGWYDSDRVRYYRWTELDALRWQEWGLAFFEKFPNDPRAIKYALKHVLSEPPYFWKDLNQGAQAYADGKPELAQIDEHAKLVWEQKILWLRQMYLTSSAIDEDARWHLRCMDLHRKVMDAMYAKKRGETVDLAELELQVLDFATLAPSGSQYDVVWLVSSHFFQSGLLEADHGNRAAFIAAMKRVPNDRLLDIANGQEEIGRLWTTPLDLKLPTSNGGEVDFAQLRGKVVLVDFWMTHLPWLR